jgi:hypothetical protein
LRCKYSSVAFADEAVRRVIKGNVERVEVGTDGVVGKVDAAVYKAVSSGSEGVSVNYLRISESGE